MIPLSIRTCSIQALAHRRRIVAFVVVVLVSAMMPLQDLFAEFHVEAISNVLGTSAQGPRCPNVGGHGSVSEESR